LEAWLHSILCQIEASFPEPPTLADVRSYGVNAFCWCNHCHHHAVLLVAIQLPFGGWAYCAYTWRTMSTIRHAAHERMLTMRLPLAFLSSLLFYSAAYAAECDTPLPDDVKIIPPSSSVPANLAKFSGQWGPAKWDDKLCHNMIVEEVTDDGKASVIYSWSVFKDWYVNKPGYRRITFDLVGDKLISSGKRAIIKYWMVGDEIHGTYQTGTFISQIVLKRH